MSQEKFTERVKTIIKMARQEAMTLSCEFVGTEHLLLGILREGGSVAHKALTNMGFTYIDALAEVRDLNAPSMHSNMLAELPLSPHAVGTLTVSHEVACQLGHDVIGSEHILLALLRGDDTTMAITVIRRMGKKPMEVRDMVLEVIGADVAPAPTSKSDHFVSAACRGRNCDICKLPASHKVGEEIPHDDPLPNRHNLTAYVCCAHFIEIMGPIWTGPCRNRV